MKQIIRTSFIIISSIVLLLLLLNACNADHKKAAVDNADNLRAFIPTYIQDSIYFSAGNPFSAAKASLGRYFFYDRRMSVNQAKSCASCHDPNFSFTDGYRRSIGALGDNVQHNAPALINIVFNKYLTAADSTLHYPEQQINNPMFHNKPVELGWTGNEELILNRLKKDSLYKSQMSLLFADCKEPFSIKNIQACVSSFVKTILSFNSPYDRFIRTSDSTILSARQRNGRRLFFSDRLHCSQCHGGINFSRPLLTDENGKPDYYQNTGLYNIGRTGAYPAGDQGLIELTRKPPDMGKYKIPTLRNLAFSAPYYHDGTAADLTAVIDVYKNGGRNVLVGDNHGDGRKNKYKNELVKGFIITDQEEKDLIGFLLSLSDSTVTRKAAYSNPFTEDETLR